MFSVDDKQIRRYERDIKDLSKKALPIATRFALNGMAKETMVAARAEVRNSMTLRNKFTERSILFRQAKGSNIRAMESATGSTADYMLDQEVSGTKTKRGSEGVSIPTPYSAGQGRGARPRKRLPRKANTLQSIRLRQNKRKGLSRKQSNLVAIKQAAESGDKFVFLDLQRRKGIFKVTGGKRRPKLQMVHDLTRQSIRIPATPWLGPAVDATAPRRREIYVDALEFQMKRLGLFR